MPMNPDIKRRWVEALRSGDFVQATGKLRLAADSSEGKPQCCCLGVLCEILDVPKHLIEGDIAYSYGSPPVRWQGALPDEVTEQTGITPSGAFAAEDNLINLNDSGSTFEEIATVIEENF